MVGHRMASALPTASVSSPEARILKVFKGTYATLPSLPLSGLPTRLDFL
jgi:hypothetical protein